jgi:small subunit ribosomal protein S20
MRTSALQRERNRALRSRLRNAIKEVRNETSKEQAVAKLRVASALLDKAANTGLLHKSNASRNKSRLTALVNKLN